MTAADPLTARTRSRADDDALVWSAWFFTAAVLLHNFDHARRGTDAVDADVFWSGTSAIALEVVVVLLVLQRHRLAPLVAAGAGGSLAIGYLVVHFLPRRRWLSDSFVSGADVDALSWIAASLETATAISLAVAGIAVLRRRGGLVSATQPHPLQRPMLSALVHPVVVVMIVGNVLVLLASAIQFGSD